MQTVKIYSNVNSYESFNESGQSFSRGTPEVYVGSEFLLHWQLCSSTPGSDTDSVNVENWIKSTEYANCTAKFTCDNDFIHRETGKLASGSEITAGSPFPETITCTINNAGNKKISSVGNITIYNLSGQQESITYSAILIDGNNVTFTLSDPGAVATYSHPADSTVNVTQQVLFDAAADLSLSDPASGLFVFRVVANSLKLQKIAETSSSKQIDIEGFELLPYSVEGENYIQYPAVFIDTPALYITMGEMLNRSQETQENISQIILALNAYVAQGFNVELYSSETDTWRPFDGTYTLADTKYRWSFAGGSEWVEVPIFHGQKGLDGATPQIGENGNWFIGEVDTGKRAIPNDAQAQYSVDASTWKELYEEGDKYIRFSTDNGVTWSASAKFIGDNAPSVQVQYAYLIGEWHDVQQSTDIYIRFSVDGGTAWTGGMQVKAFPVKFRYCETSNGTFRADYYVSTDKYMQHSVDNGVTWSSSIRITGTDGQSFVPNATGTLADRTTYDAKGKGFAYLVTSGNEEGKIYFKLSDNTADWSTGIQFTPHGLTMQFSVNGSEWHDTSTDDDIYIRFSVDGGTTWTTAARYQGKSHYVYYAYASDNAGNGFTLTFNDDLHFRNEIHTSSILLPEELTASKFNNEGLGWYQFGGSDGKTYEWYEGTTAPNPAIGADGDWYMNKDTCDLYRKDGADWRYVLNFRGKTGAGVTPRGIWDSTITYATNDMVAYHGGAYIASASSAGKIPSESPDYWVLYIEKGEDGAPISENYVIVTTLTDDGYIAVPNNNVPVKVELNGAIYDIDDCPMVNDGTNFKLLADYFLARANLTSYSGEYKVWLAGGKEGEKGDPGKAGQDGGSFVISVVTALPTDPDPYTLYLFTE